MAIRVELLSVGSCIHPEHVILRNRRLRPMRFPALVALLHHPSRGPVLFDTGYGERFFEITQRLPEKIYAWVTPTTLAPEDRIESQLRARGIDARDVQHVLISHFHADHVAALSSFPNATYHFLDGAERPIRELGRFASLRRGLLPGLLPDDFGQRSHAHSLRNARPSKMLPMLPPLVDLFDDGTVFGVPLPGHARGQMGLFVPELAEREGALLLAADAVWTRLAAAHAAHPITKLLFDDTARYDETRRALLPLFGRADLSVVPSHCEQSIAAFQRS